MVAAEAEDRILRVLVFVSLDIGRECALDSVGSDGLFGSTEREKEFCFFEESDPQFFSGHGWELSNSRRRFNWAFACLRRTGFQNHLFTRKSPIQSDKR